MNLQYLTDIHIGKTIEKWNLVHHISQAKFAQIMGMPASNAARLLKKESMDTKMLQAISLKMKHNFFREFVEGSAYDGEETRTRIVNIGELINIKLKEMKMTQVELANEMRVYQPEISKILKKSSIDTKKLAVISQILNYNFFCEYISTDADIEKTTETNSSNEILRRYEELVIENMNLKKEIQRLQKIIIDSGLSY